MIILSARQKIQAATMNNCRALGTVTVRHRPEREGMDNPLFVCLWQSGSILVCSFIKVIEIFRYL